MVEAKERRTNEEVKEKDRTMPWALQAKQGARYLDASHCDAGFVEPVPEFYGRLANLVEATRDTLDKAGALTSIDKKEAFKELVGELQAAVKRSAFSR